jgi:hypothetical protein
MKKIFNILLVAAVVAGMASCTKVKEEDAFSKAPVAPELYAHNDILITTNTLDEDVTFSWSAYRFLPEGLEYSLYASYTEEAVLLAKTTERYVTWSKSEFRTLLYQKMPELPNNDVFSLLLNVSVPNNGKELKSSSIRITVYAAGDAAAPVIEDAVEEITLSPENLDDPIELISWEPARLVYGEEITYDVFLSVVPKNQTLTSVKGDVEGDDEVINAVKLNGEPLTETSFSTTVDKLNDAIAEAGGEEMATNRIQLDVVAYCASLPNGVPSAEPAYVTVDTYKATYDPTLALVGSWAAGSAPILYHSEKVKGTYEGVVDLTDAGAFTFGELGFDIAVETKGEGDNQYAVVTSSTPTEKAFEVPGGLYYVNMDAKRSKLTMVQIKSLGIVGDMVGGWDQDIDMSYDASANRFMAVANVVNGKFKIRFNHAWDYSFGGDVAAVVFNSNDNFDASYEGEYKVILNVGKAPFSVGFVNANLPETLYMVGTDFGNWDWASEDVVELVPVVYNPAWNVTTTEGQFWTIRYLTAGHGVKFNGNRAWDGQQFGSLAQNDGFTNDKDGNVVVAESGLYMIHIDMVNGILHLEPARVYGIGDCFGGWTEGMEDALFQHDGKKMKITVPNGGEIRMYAASEISTSDWWTREFVFFDGKIAYRGNAGDQDRVRVFKDKVVTLDFNAGTATVTGEGEGPQAPDIVSLIGTLNNSEWKIDYDMETLDGETWTIKGVSLTADDMFKIRENHAWTTNYGGPEVSGKVGEDDVYTPELGKEFAAGSYNICVGKDGEYAITFKWDAEHPTILIEEYQKFPEHLYMIGAEFGGWDWASDGVVEMTPVIHKPEWNADAEGQFYTVRYFTAGEGFKFCATKAWNGDFWGLETNDGYTEVNGNCTVAEDGFYLVHIDFKAGKVHVEPARVYGIGDAFGGWDEEMEDARFVADGKVLKATVAKAGNIRMYVASSIATSPWWTREFNVIEGKIVPRLMDELPGVPALANQVVKLDFNAGTGAIEGEGVAPTLPQTMFIIGEAINGWSDFVPMHAFHSQEGMFWIIRYLEADKAFKFSPVADWKGDFNQLDTNEGFETVDTNCKVTASGVYCIGVDCANSKIIVEPAKVYGIGEAFGGWEAQPVAFQVEGQTLVGTATTDGNIRTYVDSKILSSTNDWWHAEFIPKDGAIVYRETGGDPEDVAITADQKIIYDFNAGTAVIQ